MNIQKGQIVTVKYEDRDFELVVIDPDGFGVGQPTVGFGFKMMEIYSRYYRSQTFSRWVNADPDNFEYIKHLQIKDMQFIGLYLLAVMSMQF